MGHDHLLRDIHAFEAMARNALTSAHAPRRPIVEELNRIAKDFEESSKEDDAGRTKKLVMAGLRVEPEWPEKTAFVPVHPKIEKEFIKRGEPAHGIPDASQ